MLKAVLDTSILVSAFLKHSGVNARVLQQAKDRFQLYLSEDILEETIRVLLTYERIRKK
jgi:predicted nucleic acid-binding protein